MFLYGSGNFQHLKTFSIWNQSATCCWNNKFLKPLLIEELKLWCMFSVRLARHAKHLRYCYFELNVQCLLLWSPSRSSCDRRMSWSSLHQALHCRLILKVDGKGVKIEISICARMDLNRQIIWQCSSVEIVGYAGGCWKFKYWCKTGYLYHRCCVRNISDKSRDGVYSQQSVTKIRRRGWYRHLVGLTSVCNCQSRGRFPKVELMPVMRNENRTFLCCKYLMLCISSTTPERQIFVLPLIKNFDTDTNLLITTPQYCT